MRALLILALVIVFAANISRIATVVGFFIAGLISKRIRVELAESILSAFRDRSFREWLQVCNPEKTDGPILRICCRFVYLIMLSGYPGFRIAKLLCYL
jgi:hypothetical protein